MLILGVKMTDPTSSFIFALIVSVCGVQGTAISSRTGNVTAIVGYPLTLSWTHSFLDSDIDLCYYQSKKRYLDEFLGWSNKNRERLNITDNHHGWDFINKKMPCQDGIRREDTEIRNAGQYKIYMQTTDGQRHEGQWINVTIVSGSELYYTLTINETEVTENIAHQSALPTLQIEDHGLTKFSISLGKDFADSNITLSAHFVNSSNVETLQTCPMSVSCSGNFTAKTDLVQISANIESGIQGFELVRIQQPVIVIDQSPITAATVVYPMVGLIVAVVFLVLFLLMLIILLICLCNKRARHLKKVRKYLLRKHVSAKRVDLQLSATFPVKPHAGVEWFRDREKLKDGTGTGVKVWNENNTYSIRIKADHVKPGMYHFHALDQWDEPITHHARVTIGGSKEGDKTTGNSKPEFKDTTYLKDKRFRRDDPLNLSVSVSGFPPPVVNWYRDNQLLTQSPGHIDINQSEGTAMLTVTPSSNSDSLAGEYYCKAVNNSGHVQSQTIRVQVEPDNGDEAQEVYENVTNWNKPIPQVSAGQGMTATAKFSYQAANDDELSFEEGDIITNIEKVPNEEGWWKGECHGLKGLFPDNYVKFHGSENRPDNIA